MSKRDYDSGEAASPHAEKKAGELEAGESDPIPLPRQVGSRFVTGARNIGGGLKHTITTGHQTDDEIRRLLVERQLNAHENVRETAREELDAVTKRIVRLELRGAEDGWTDAEKREISGLRAERKMRDRALRDLLKDGFTPRQPTSEQIARARRISSAKRVVGTGILCGCALALSLKAPQFLLLALPTLLGALWWKGGSSSPEFGQRAVPERLLARPELAPPAPGEEAGPGEMYEPFPIRDVTTAADAQEALRRALVHEGADIESVGDGVREPWGWSVRVVCSSGSPDDFNEQRTYRNLITLLKLRRNGLLIETDPEFGDTCTVRMVLRDPFTPEVIGSVPYRGPLSRSIMEPSDYGVGMDSTPLIFTLAGLMLLMVADSGGGKSGVMLAMGEVATACYDAVVINLDPAGTGIGDLGPAITLNACMDDKRIRAVLEFLLQYCSARARQRAAYGWGNKWRVCREHPAICVFVDEWPQLSEKTKKLLVRLLLLGRKEAIWVFAGSQFGTKEYLGEAIGPKLSAKLLGACRRVDITELMGAGAVAEGYRADLIQAATHTEKNDAGQIYAHGLPGMPNKPMRYQVREISPEYAARVATERRDAGLPDLTHTLTEAGQLKAWEQLQTICAGGADYSPGAAQTPVPEILSDLRDAFSLNENPDFLTMDQIHDHLRTVDPDRWGQWDGRPDKDRLRELGKAVRRALQEARVEGLSSERLTELEGAPRGFRRAAVEEALEAPVTPG
ncbi:hypothetical protein ACFWIY_34690 [Streptomyces sioyaensis]|uniref:hypothetical protein n=1 Tax=Streptomyces sioyaensis TaxID=67364 RepID=UPI0036517598